MLILGVRTVSMGTRKTQQRRGPCERELSSPAARDFNPYYPLSPFYRVLVIVQRDDWTGRDSRLNFQGEPPGRTPEVGILCGHQVPTSGCCQGGRAVSRSCVQGCFSLSVLYSQDLLMVVSV